MIAKTSVTPAEAAAIAEGWYGKYDGHHKDRLVMMMLLDKDGRATSLGKSAYDTFLKESR